MPTEAWDLAVGAAAGGVAVLLSHPLDVIKTQMECGGKAAAHAAAGSGAAGSVAAFGQTARNIWATQGPRGLAVGLGPRLVEQVPSTMLYWFAVEGCRRLLEPHTAPA
jgi:hypothetical protein